ncbi:MAG: Rieske 2Fe-2S domain-containing protein [Planctomycetaceae bacterium]
MAKQKLTTAEILAQARKQGALGAGGDEAASPPASPPPSSGGDPQSVAAESSASAPSATKKPAAKPGSTADILAAARAQGSTGGGGATEKSTPAAKPAAKPGGPSDILAAARSQGAGSAAPQKPAAKPGSTADILAAARAGKSGAAAAKAPAKPAVEKVSSKPASTAAGAGERPSVQEMVKAARQGVPAPAAASVTKPRLPARPPVSANKAAGSSTRRSFFGSAIVRVTEPFMAAWVAMGAIAAVWGLATARFMMPNMIVEPPTKFKIGPASDYPPGSVSNKWKAARGIWVVNTDQYDGRNLIYALASVCTHLGCTPNWLDGEQKFKCPCHGSGFYITGINFEGPAPRPLERVGLRMSEDGTLEVVKSVKFQEELGQWQDPASFVELA